MAVIATPKDTVMVVTYQVDTTTEGSPVLRQRSFPNVKSEAVDQDIFDVANALYGLQDYPVTEVRRDNRVDLAE